MRFPALILAATACFATVQAEGPDETLILNLRAESILDRHLPAPTSLRRTATVEIVGQSAYITVPGQEPQAIYTSLFELKGALTSPDGRLVALVESSEAAGDRPILLHRIEQERGARYIVESAASAAEALVAHIFASDPALKVRPSLIRLAAVRVHPANDFQFILTGDKDLRDRSFTLIITEEATPVLPATGTP